jgi:hypothetical protein
MNKIGDPVKLSVDLIKDFFGRNLPSLSEQTANIWEGGLRRGPWQNRFLQL